MKRTGVARAPSHKGEQLRDKVDAQLASIKKTPRLVQPFSNPIWGFRLSYGQKYRLSGCFGCHTCHHPRANGIPEAASRLPVGRRQTL